MAINYSETILWLYAQLPMYQREGKAAYKANLDNTLALAAYLGNPENDFKSIHVAGTNGKGSTSHMLASVLQESGYTVGLYTSPHLKDFRERIKIDGEMIPKRFVSSFVSKHKDFFEKQQLSFFEMTVGLAFHFFSAKKVDIAVIEVGLGGRLDSTNIITPQLSIITNIGLDHTQFLGTTHAEIATEKAGIIKPNIPVVIGEAIPETKPVFEAISEVKKSPIYFVEDDTYSVYSSDLQGSYQELNKRTLLKSIEILQKLNWKISEKNIQKGLQNVIANTALLGRWQLLQEHPKIICDTAHNKEGLQYVLSQLASETFDKLHIVLGVVSDKDLNSILPLFPKEAVYYFCTPKIARGLSVSSLQAVAKQKGLIGLTYNSVANAFEDAKKCAAPTDVIFVGGSTFVVAEVL